MTLGAASGSSYPFVLSALEFDVLWEHLRLGNLPLVLQVPSPGKTDVERNGYVRQAWAGIEYKGLGRSVELHPELEDLLMVLAHGQREVTGRLWLGRKVRVLAAAGRGMSGVRAVLANDELSLWPISAEGLPRAAVSALPEMAAGPGQSVTLPSADLEWAAGKANGTPGGLESALRDRGVRQQDARTLTTMMKDAGPQFATGQFGAAARDRWGKRASLERVVAFFDTPHGRYVQQRRENRGGGPAWSTIAPVDNRRLVPQVEELLAEAVDLAER